MYLQVIEEARKYFCTYASLNNANKLANNKYTSTSTILILKDKSMQYIFSMFCMKYIFDILNGLFSVVPNNLPNFSIYLYSLEGQ